jgi:hypothetical protein
MAAMTGQRLQRVRSQHWADSMVDYVSPTLAIAVEIAPY